MPNKTDKMEKKSVEFIKNFVKDILGGDINKLKDFSFLNLYSDKKYIEDEYKDKITDVEIHKYGGYFYKTNCNRDVIKYTLHQNENDYDDMNIIRAINYLLYFNKLPFCNNQEKFAKDLDWEYFGEKPHYNNYYFRGETINTFHTLINEDNYKEYFKGVEVEDIDGTIIDKIDKFLYKAFSIGNFMLLPNKKGENLSSLNQYKRQNFNDYSDSFFKYLFNDEDKYINKLKEENDFYFKYMKIEDFIRNNYLDSYFDKGQVNYSFSRHFRHQDFDKKQDIKVKQGYANFIKEYIDIVTKKIEDRAERMVEDLKKKYPELAAKTISDKN